MKKVARAIVVADGARSLIDLTPANTEPSPRLVYVGGREREMQGRNMKWKTYAVHFVEGGEHRIVETPIGEQRADTAEVWAVSITSEVIVACRCFWDDIEALETAGFVSVTSVEFKL